MKRVNERERLSVGFVLLPSFTLLPFSAFVDCLRLASDEGDMSRQMRCRWTFMTCDSEAAQASCGALIHPCVNYQDPSLFDYIVVVGGVKQRVEAIDQVTIDYLRLAARKDVPLIGLCTGVFALVQAGLMQGRRCCISWYHHADLLKYSSDIEPVADRLFIDDGNRITCAGGIAAADLAAYLIERHVGRAWAKKSLHIMLIDEVRQGSHPQPHPVIFDRVKDKQVRRAITMIEQNIDEVVSIEDLSHQLGSSRRSLERKFRDTLGMSPQRFARELRLRYGLWLLVYTSNSITHISQRSGFSDTAHFSRSIKESFGTSPSQIRQQRREDQEMLVDPFFIHVDLKRERLGERAVG